LSQFSRRARWLNRLFTASVAPQTSDPSSVSDDVSLVQPYDGSGWPIPTNTSWIQQFDTAVGISVQTDLFTIPEGFVYRLFGASGFAIIQPSPNGIFFVKDKISTPNTAVNISGNIDFSLFVGNHRAELNQAIVIPAGLILAFDYTGGAAGTQMRVSIYGALCPEGTVFYC